LSKLSQLKQEAYQAGKKREWIRAVAIYEQILEMDKTNPTLINELGDLCLKAGNTAQGVKHFLGAASKYRQSGLLNNAVAIYKKILRYDEENQNAHWYLSESRASQGLLVEGEKHALIFLGASESVSGDIKEIFLKRCAKLFELYPDSLAIQDNLLHVYRMWTMPMEAGRAQIQVACLQSQKGEQETAERMVAEALAQLPELSNYPEHGRWREMQGLASLPAGVGDFDSVSLEDPLAGSAAAIPEAPAIEEIPEVAEIQIPEKSEDDFGEISFGDISPPTEIEIPADNEPLPAAEVESPAPVAETVAPEAVPDDRDEGGCFNLDLGETSNFDDLIAQATAGLPKVTSDDEDFSDLNDIQSEDVSAPENVQEADSSVNLLDEILSDDQNSGWQAPEGEVETISEEIGSQMGGDSSDDDPASLYEMGMVYLEMGLHDQACTSFQKASCHPDYAIRAIEMWGITLLRMNKNEEAIAVLTDGLDIPEEGSREYLGLLYHIARANEAAENRDEAQRLYRMISEQDAGFLDVNKRLVKQVI
jgi:tetratricopeptide (TPR) repeat protein